MIEFQLNDIINIQINYFFTIYCDYKVAKTLVIVIILRQKTVIDKTSHPGIIPRQMTPRQNTTDKTPKT